jgi:hypothetical protein
MAARHNNGLHPAASSAAFVWEACRWLRSVAAGDAERYASTPGVTCMKGFLALILMAATLNFCVASAAQRSDFDVERLSPRGRAAYQKLVSADIFRVGGVGYSGETSEQELALYDLLDERDSCEALKSLVGGGSYEGGLYGLLGLSITNVGEFNRAVEVYKSREQPPERRMSEPFAGLGIPEGRVAIQSGCVVEADDWLKLVSNIQSGRYDRSLRKKRG